MKKTATCFLFKLFAFVLCLLCLLTAVAGTTGLILMGESGILHLPESNLRTNTLNDMVYSTADDVVSAALYSDYGASSRFPADACNLRYQVSLDGHVIDTNADFSQLPPTLVHIRCEWTGSDFFPLYHDMPGIQKLAEHSTSSLRALGDIRIEAELYLSTLELTDEFRFVSDAIHLLCAIRPHIGWFIGGGLLLGVLLLVYLFCAAGRRPKAEGVTANPLDRIPGDLYLAVCTGLCLLLIALTISFIEAMLYGSGFTFGWLIPIGLCLLAVASIALGFFLSVATRIKLNLLWKNTLIWRVLRLLGRGLRWVWRGLCRTVRSLPSIGQTALILAGVLLADFLITILLINLWYEEDIELFYWFIRALVTASVTIAAALSLRDLRRSCRALAEGSLDAPVDTHRMLGGFKTAGEDLNNIRTGMALAVEERMKSERMKTELFTNVSHDIRTPLTSIISYVDLIKKEQPESDVMRSYVEVLDRQSARLKKLTDDLIEASKASSGVLPSTPEPCELGVMLQQCTGEYAEKLAAAALTPVVKHPESPVYILADGRHLARIFDNLLSNACKYSQPGTRLYLTLTEAEGRAVITFRNISRDALNISGDELMERFVRGDRSRHTDGSGLGLSIARSLVELQNGDMKLEVDGDLFKVTLSFAVAPAPAAKPAEPRAAVQQTAAEPTATV